jgi:hypothetical protein
LVVEIGGFGLGLSKALDFFSLIIIKNLMEKFGICEN